MQDIQEVFTRLQQNKKRLKDLRNSYKEALAGSQSYVELLEQMKVMKAKKSQLETEVRGNFANEFSEMEDIKIDVASDTEMIADMALTKMMKGEEIDIKDEYENEYQPIFAVKFKKSK